MDLNAGLEAMRYSDRLQGGRSENQWAVDLIFAHLQGIADKRSAMAEIFRLTGCPAMAAMKLYEKNGLVPSLALEQRAMNIAPPLSRCLEENKMDVVSYVISKSEKEFNAMCTAKVRDVVLTPLCSAR